MSSGLNHDLLVDDDLQEQICYVQCGYCATILLVSVPCSSLTQVVTVRCGHCSCLLSVNMTNASFLPHLQHLFSSFNYQSTHDDQEPITETLLDDHHHHAVEVQKGSEILLHNIPSPSPVVVSFSSSDDDEEEEETQVINKPPEKRQRAPSAYNLFIGQEIQRLKGMYPSMTHKQAFSMASKNWAHFPLSCGQRKSEVPGMKADSSNATERVSHNP